MILWWISDKSSLGVSKKATCLVCLDLDIYFRSRDGRGERRHFKQCVRQSQKCAVWRDIEQPGPIIDERKNTVLWFCDSLGWIWVNRIFLNLFYQKKKQVYICIDSCVRTKRKLGRRENRRVDEEWMRIENEEGIPFASNRHQVLEEIEWTDANSFEKNIYTYYVYLQERYFEWQITKERRGIDRRLLWPNSRSYLWERKIKFS